MKLLLKDTGVLPKADKALTPRMEYQNKVIKLLGELNLTPIFKKWAKENGYSK